MNVVIDWDGTVTAHDTLSAVLKQFVDPAILIPLEERIDAALESGMMSLRDAMGLEFATLTAPLDAVVDFVVAHATIRPGFGTFAARYDPLIVSTSFRQTIEPVLQREAMSARLVATEAQPSSAGWTMRWVSASPCGVCGEPCKRGVMPPRVDVYVGDGYSDRCAAQLAKRIFARDGLATYLDRIGVPYERFADFTDVASALT